MLVRPMYTIKLGYRGPLRGPFSRSCWRFLWITTLFHESQLQWVSLRPSKEAGMIKPQRREDLDPGQKRCSGLKPVVKDWCRSGEPTTGISMVCFWDVEIWRNEYTHWIVWCFPELWIMFNHPAKRMCIWSIRLKRKLKLQYISILAAIDIFCWCTDLFLTYPKPNFLTFV